MGADAAPPIDVTLEAPVSVGLLLDWANEQHAEAVLGLLGRAFEAARAAGIERLQDEGGWCVVRGREYRRDTLQIQPYRHYLAGEHVDTPRPHEHLYVGGRTRSGERTHQDLLPTAALGAQLSYGRALARELEDGGVDIRIRTRTPAGWELATVADRAAAIPRQVCRPTVPVAQQIVPTDRWADQGAA